jgi:hypothetical protein
MNEAAEALVAVIGSLGDNDMGPKVRIVPGYGSNQGRLVALLATKKTLRFPSDAYSRLNHN